MASKPRTITIVPTKSLLKKHHPKQNVIVLPQDKKVIFVSESNLRNLTKYNNKADSTYGSGSESEDGSIKARMVIKKPRLKNLSEKEKMLRRRLKNRQAAQTARDKKRAYMEEMEAEVKRLDAYAKSLQEKNALLINENLRLKSQAGQDIKLETQDIKVKAQDIKVEAEDIDLDTIDIALEADEAKLFDMDLEEVINELPVDDNDPIFSSDLIKTYGDPFPDLPNDLDHYLY